MDFSQLGRTEVLNNAINIIAGFNTENAKICLQIAQMVTQLETNIARTRKIIQEKKISVEKIKQLSQEYDEYDEYLTYIDENLPEVASEEMLNQLSIEDKYIMNQEVSPTVNNKSKDTDRMLCVKRLQIDDCAAPQNEVASPRLQYISVQQLNTVHKYMRGRLTVEDLNMFIDLFNSVLKKKYAILKQPRSKLKPNDQELYMKWKKGIKDAALPRGTYFCVAGDFVTLENHKMTKTCFSKLVVLRHLKLVREARCGSDTLYIV